MKQPTLAAIDLGTNSCRLLIADRSGRTLYKNAISTRLGEGMSAGNRFTDEAVMRGIECFCTFKMTMDEYGTEKYRQLPPPPAARPRTEPNLQKKSSSSPALIWKLSTVMKRPCSI